MADATSLILAGSAAETTVERRTAVAQNPAQNAAASAQSSAHDQQRLHRLFDHDGQGDDGDDTFDAARIARAELQKVCEELVASSQVAQQSRFRRRKAKVEQKISSSLQASIDGEEQSVLNVNETVSLVEDSWKANHGKVYKNFQRLCTGLKAHEKVFALFPSNSTYASVLSGALSCLVQASVNHTSIAELLSQSVADISDKVAVCAIYLEVAPTLSMKKRLAEIYSQLFRFYRDVLKWYMSSSASKLFTSFNASIEVRYKDTVQSIENQISQMVREGDIAALAIMRVVQLDQNDLRAEMSAQYNNIKILLETLVMQQRGAPQEHADANIGLKVLESLGTVYKAMAAQGQQRPRPAQISNIVEVDDDMTPEERRQLLSSQTDELAKTLQAYVIGSDGSALMAHGGLRAREHTIPYKLKTMLERGQKSQTLWLSGEYSNSSESNTQTIALAFAAAAWKVGAPILSHFCDTSKRVQAQQGELSIEQRGVLGLVYSLIRQLLQFGRLAEDQVNLADSRYTSLQLDNQSWQGALDLLSELLAATPTAQYCLIHGLNNMEWASGGPWLGAVLDVLFDHQKNTSQPFHILLVTAGQSRLLGTRVKPAERHILQETEVDLS